MVERALHGHEADHSNDLPPAPPAAPFLDVKEILKAVIVALATYMAVSMAQRPEATADQLHKMDTRLAVLEQVAQDQHELSVEVRDYMRRHR